MWVDANEPVFDTLKPEWQQTPVKYCVPPPKDMAAISWLRTNAMSLFFPVDILAGLFFGQFSRPRFGRYAIGQEDAPWV
jgi:hypothetical protein